MNLNKYWHYKCPNHQIDSVIFAVNEADFADYREDCDCKEATIIPALNSPNPHILITALESELENMNRPTHLPRVIFKKIVTSPLIPTNNYVWLAIARAIVGAYEEAL